MRKSTTKQHNALPIHIACLTGNKKALKGIISTVPRQGLELKDYLGRTPLILTVSRNNIDCGSVLLKAGVTVDNTDNAGQTALHVAAYKGFHQFVRLLLITYKASWMQRDYFGATALHMAAIHPNVKGLTLIIRHAKPAEIDIQDSSLKTALHWSAAYACNDNIKVLLAQGANACIPDEDGKTPLHWAVANSNPEALDCVKTLLKKEPNLINWQDYQGRSPLHVAVASGSEEILYFLASRENCNVDILDNAFCTPLHCASKRGLSEKADILLKKRASHLSRDDNGATPLHYAAHNNHAETVQVFSSKTYINDEPDRFGRSALMWAAVKNSEAALLVLFTITETLLYADRNGVTALHVAAIYGHVPAVEILVNAGLHVDVKDNYGMTPFLRACEFGRSKAAQALINLGADINNTDINCCSALHWCARGGHAYLTQILIKHGAHYNIQDSLRMSPLHYVSTTGDFINCTCVLVESGADPNITDIDGRTPLHTAVLNERIGIVKYLCEHDSDVNSMFLLGNDWVTPYDCAIIKCNMSIAVLLRQFGGIRAQEIRECAAEVLQVWFRKINNSKEHKSIKNASSSLPWLDSSSSQDVYHTCNGCFHVVHCDHVCNENCSSGKVSILESKLPACMKEKKVFVTEAVSVAQVFGDAVVIPKQNMPSETAARIIQRAWKRYVLKKSFASNRQFIEDTFSVIDMEIEEEIWGSTLENFYQCLDN